MLYWLIVVWFDGTHHCPWRRSKLVYAEDTIIVQDNKPGLHTANLSREG